MSLPLRWFALLLLAACVGPCAGPASDSDADPVEPAPSPTPDAAPAAADEAPPPPKVDHGPVLYQVVVDMHNDLATGARAFRDGTVEIGGGSLTGLTWTAERQLGPEDVAEIERLLASDGLAALPKYLESPGAVPGETPTATWTFRVGDELRTISTEAYTKIRVPAFDRIDALLRGARRIPKVFTHVTFVPASGQAQTWDVPCDPSSTPLLRPAMIALLDPGLPAASTERPSGLLVQFDLGTGVRARRIALYDDGRIFRTDEKGGITAFQLDAPAAESVVERMSTVDPAEAAKGCN